MNGGRPWEVFWKIVTSIFGLMNDYGNNHQ